MALNTPFAALASACIAAAAAGGYLVARSSGDTAARPSTAIETPDPAAVQPGFAAVNAQGANSVAETGNTAPVAARTAATPADRRPASTAARTEQIAQRSNEVPRSSDIARGDATAHNTTDSQDAGSTMSQTPATNDHHAEAPLPSSSVPAAADGASTWTAPAAPVSRELVVPADSVIGLRMETAVSSETAAVEDRVEARVVRDVLVGDDSAIPAGSRLIGSVTSIDRGGKFKEQARLGIRFHTLVTGDGMEQPVSTEAIYRYGNAVANKTAAKIGGGAVAGAILGAIVGGSKGAAVGATSGAGAGTAVVMAGDRSEAIFAAGTELTARILSPIPITLED